MSKVSSLEDIVLEIKSGQKIFVQGGDATPKTFLEKLATRSNELENVYLYHLHTHGDATYQNFANSGSFVVRNFFVGSNFRRSLNYNTVDYVPCFLSEIPSLFKDRTIDLDWAVIQVSAPDTNGYVTLGTSVDVTLSAVKYAKKVIAQINPNMPKVFGDGVIHISEIDHMYECVEEIAEAQPKELSSIDDKIGKNVATLIEDGSTLQVGIGAVPDAVLKNLTNHKDLGLHTEMWTNSCLDLFKKGVINNKHKAINNGISISSFIIGNKEVHDYIHDNLRINQKRVEYVNNPAIIKKNPKVCAINSAVEIDLTGQVCADSVGSKIISGVGGQMDFMRGAALSEGGKPIIAIHSRTRSGQSKLVPMLKRGAGVVTTRAHVNWIVTEYGAVSLKGLSIGDRAKALISISHPDDRENLERNWSEVVKSL